MAHDGMATGIQADRRKEEEKKGKRKDEGRKAVVSLLYLKRRKRTISCVQPNIMCYALLSALFEEEGQKMENLNSNACISGEAWKKKEE